MIQAVNRPMVLAIDDHSGLLHDKLQLASGHVYNNNSTTSSSEDTAPGGGSNRSYCNNWSAWSPIVDWDAFHGCQDDFHNLMDYSSIIDNNQTYNDHHGRDHAAEDHHDSSGNCKSGSSTGDTIMVDHEHDLDAPGGGEDDFKGVRLVHLLMAAADALTGENPSRDLARVILVRLKDLVTPSGSTNMERLAAYFTQALQILLDGNGGGPTSGLHSRSPDHHHDHHNPTDVVAAFQLLLDTTPYVKFGHFTANQAILEAVANDRRVHIVDYDIMEGIQWSSLMQALVSRKEGLPAPHLRITAISRGGNGKRFMGTIQETGRRLTAFAATIGLPFSFHQCRLDSDESFRPSALKVVRGEALIINCMLNLPHFSYRSPESIASFLSGSKSLNPRLINLVEEEVGPTENGRFKTRFMDTLHHYSSIYDSLEAGFPMQNQARTLVERVFLGPRIADSVSRIYRATGRGNEETGFCSWGEWLGAGGCRPLEMSFANHCQARLLLGLFNDGYRVENMAHNKLVLGWKSKRLLSASIWASCSTSSSSDSDPEKP